MMSEIRQAIDEDRYEEYKQQKLEGMGFQPVPITEQEAAEKYRIKSGKQEEKV